MSPLVIVDFELLKELVVIAITFSFFKSILVHYVYMIFIFQNENGLSHLLVPSPSCNDWGIDLKSRQNSAGRLKFSALLLLQGSTACLISKKQQKSTKNLVKLPRPLKTVSPVCSSYYCSYLSSQKSWCTHMLGLYVTCWNYTALSAYRLCLLVHSVAGKPRQGWPRKAAYWPGLGSL